MPAFQEVRRQASCLFREVAEVTIVSMEYSWLCCDKDEEIIEVSRDSTYVYMMQAMHSSQDEDCRDEEGTLCTPHTRGTAWEAAAIHVQSRNAHF